MTTNKKDDHIELTQRFHQKNKVSDFDNLKFIHHSFPEININDVDIKTKIGDMEMEHPFFINAMTGGSSKSKIINEKLAFVAKETNTLIASGSLSSALKDETVKNSFEVLREINKKGLILANLGAEHSVENVRKAMRIIDADGIQIHINSLQELIMPKGDIEFKGWLKNIEKIVKEINKPVIVKEVGAGMSSKTIKELIGIGVKIIDISGRGGTNFSQIENYRREKIDFNYLENFGQSTPFSLLEAEEDTNKADIIASGGIRNSMDIVKSLSLGAKAVGVSGLILNILLESGVDKTIETLNSWKYEIKVIMTLLGSIDISELRNTDILISNKLKEFSELREIDVKKYANRSKK